MTDLTYCYLHMTRHDIEVLDTIGTPDYLNGDLSVDDVDVAPHMRPPNPEESDVLPSQVHPSYPYGNPLSIKHPASLPRRPYDPASRALFEDMGYGGGGVNGSLRWKDLALDMLFPVDQAREEAERAAQARKMASGTTSNHPPPQPPPPQEQTVDEDEEIENDENDSNEDEEGESGDEGDGEPSFQGDEE
ncbi:hypothetical protein PYCCODRAFT_1450870 [Trametes coccinea BRFM310]|uniref:Uncharacterized protein n=1 Tax=Trametes coccinea (strain BRFM310) TaxID=1353009 RepID=A0A1Y2IW72_TRAC3|nr:hypothetical protein PYCCODRAFT_1450870 [Trametes coccinea BRFM310]